MSDTPTQNASSGQQLPRYKCHKVVRAAKIVAIHDNAKAAGHILDLGDYGQVHVSDTWVQQKLAKTGGYYVLYEDGFASWSPAGAFEDGYTRE